MSLIQTALLAVMPPNRKQTPSGWISFNAPCCHHRGERMDDRKRGGVMLEGDGFIYHCFNCNFSAGWQDGTVLGENARRLFAYMGMSENEILKLSFDAFKNKTANTNIERQASYILEEKELPENCRKFEEVEDITDPDFLDVVDYVVNQRMMGLDWYDWMWSTTSGYRDRVIIPFYHQGKIVGYTGRKIKDGKPKYLTHAQPGYVFNLSAQPVDRKYVIVVEGQFDAIAVDGVAIMHNDPNETQIARIKALGREVIVVPDRDRAGSKMLKAAIEQGWSVSTPPWDTDIKDVADAVRRYGRLYTLATILYYRESNQIKIQLLKKKLEHVE